MCLRRAPEKYIAGAALDRAGRQCGILDVSTTLWGASTACYGDTFNFLLNANFRRGQTCEVCNINV
jgi:hypothetical protein